MLHIPKPGLPSGRAETSIPAMDAAATQPQKVDDLYVLRLKVPIRTHNGSMSTINLRKPVASDFIEIGRLPFEIRGGEDENRRAIVDFKIVAQWAAALSGLDQIVIGQLEQSDWLALVARINLIVMLPGGTDVGK